MLQKFEKKRRDQQVFLRRHVYFSLFRYITLYTFIPFYDLYDYAKKLNIQKKKYKIMLMLMHRLNTTMDINVKEILRKRLPKVQDGELALHNKKTVA